MRLHKILLTGFCCFACFYNPLLAQNTKIEENKYNENVIIVGSYEPTLSDAFKINLSPSIFDTLPRIPKLEYKINPRIYSTLFSPDNISPAKVVGEPINRLYRNYARIGIGTYLSPLAEFYFNSSRSRNNSYGAYLQHNSSWWNIPDYGTSTFSNTTVDVFGKHFWKQSMLGAEVFYTNNFYHYYGFKENSAEQLLGKSMPEGSDYSQVYNNIGLKASYKSLYTTNDKLHHQIDFAVSNLSEKYGADELNVKANVAFEKAFSLFQNDLQTLGLDVNLDLDRFGLKDGSFPVTNQANSDILAIGGGDFSDVRTILNFHPFFEFGLKNFLLNIGANISLGLADETDVFIYPDIKISQAFWRNQINLYAGLSGGLAKNSLQTLRLNNPYISNAVERKFTDNKINIYGGAIFTPAKQFDLRIEAMYSRTDDYALFGVDTFFVLQNVYKTIYDNVDLFKLNAELGYQYNKALRIAIGAGYCGANPHNEDKFWYNPAFNTNLTFQYTIADKIVAALGATIYSPSDAYYFSNGVRIEEQLKTRVDLNLSLQYNYSKSLSAFLLLNNLANQRYFEWYNYPSQKFKAMVGVTYSF